MTTIVVLPAPAPQPESRPGRARTSDGDFSRTLQDAVGRSREDRVPTQRGRADAAADRAPGQAAPGHTAPGHPAAGHAPDGHVPSGHAASGAAGHAPATEGDGPTLTTLRDVVDEAVAALTGATDGDPLAGEAGDAVPTGAPDDGGPLAVVLDLTARLAAQSRASGPATAGDEAGARPTPSGTATPGTAPAGTAATDGASRGEPPVGTPGDARVPTAAGARGGAEGTTPATPAAQVGGPAEGAAGQASAQGSTRGPAQGAAQGPPQGPSTGPAASVVPTGPATGVAVVGAPAEAPSVATPAPPVPAGGTPQAPPLTDQLGARLAALRALPAGDHVLTLRVDPESFGPVRVVAHIGTDGVRIELVGASDAAREALRSALPDLRRDLAATGLSAQLDLGRDGQGGAAGRADGGPGDGSRRGTAAPDARRGDGPAAPGAVVGGTPIPTSPTGGLDLLV